MASKIDLTCAQCGVSFQIALREYNRQIRKGRDCDRFFCSSSCSTKHGHERKIYDNKAAYERLMACGKSGKISNPFNWFVLRARTKAKKIARKECKVTAEYLSELFESQGGKCPITGWQLKLPQSTNGWSTKSKPDNASLDRLDYTQGYIPGNVRFVALMANYARNIFSDSDVGEFAKAVVKTLGLKL